MHNPPALAVLDLVLEKGLSPDYVAPDGRNAYSILAEVGPPGSAYSPEDSVARERFLAVLKSVPRVAPGAARKR